ncbi:MAG TPA: efflux RND transporter periplasmic adaptor subunit [Hyphomicrobiaceae bacterium]|nr:efflux RND transporter periplasmic adaptor subunit [Hyphomicrobiaceae bacterium]
MNLQPRHDEHLEIRGLLGLDKPHASRVMDRKYLVAGAVAAALLLLLAAAIFFRGGSSSGQRYVVEATTRIDLTVIITATGSVQPTNQVDVSSELSGTIRSVLVDYNSPVRIGQVLAELDTDKVKATLNSSRAKLTSAKAKVLDAEATLVEKKLVYERKATLTASRISSQQDLDTAKAAYDRAIAAAASSKADVAVAEADVELNETNLLKSRIVSPINGVVLKRNVDPGQTVASSLQAPVLFTIAEDLTQMEVQVDVDEADVGKVKEGQPGTFSVDAFPDRKFQARIRELRYGSEVVQGVVTYKAVLSTDNSDLLLRPGMTATAEIVVQHVANALTVPNAALRYTPPSRQSAEETSLLRRLGILRGRPPFRPASQREQSGPNRRVWVLKNGAPSPVPVVAGLSDGQRTEILKGDLNLDQGVIVDSATAKP